MVLSWKSSVSHYVFRPNTAFKMFGRYALLLCHSATFGATLSFFNRYSHPELFHKNSENPPKMHCFHSNLYSHPELFHKNSENPPNMHCFHSNLQITYILRKWLRYNYVIFTQNCWLGCVFQLWILQNFSEYFFYSTPVNGCLCFKCDTLLIGSKYFSVFFLRTHILSGF